MELNKATWRKSSYSGGNDGNHCIELAAATDVIGVRDSKARSLGHLSMSRKEFAQLSEAIKAL
ncbi:DUF397 domain-containing protein [Actinomadura parmotrematis]|uniref:DUF397 domain-containing protein n=1 Tax=Actinomadura parmotrematis TaxID=2864039 RepID=A0ABS7FUS2_9ACTN|nr:DUF397 domain-containing protein [Actinomadura parmotrematis]MBW8484159.1 DUF397 domain-containing protein [Actinomadura parmotrematis]